MTTCNTLHFPLLARTLLSLWLLLAASQAEALQLPAPLDLEKDASLKRQTVEVVEPHSSTPERPLRVTYIGVPIADLLNRWFGDAWKAPGIEVEFLTQDGYRSVIPASRLFSLPAYLATARADGKPFELDNWEQKERAPLGPYYLIWDNLKRPELLRQGASGWPYQVNRIKLQKAGDIAALLPPDADAETLLGRADTEANCLTCHHLRNVGGEKYPEDLSTALCRWTEADLQHWIMEPSRVRPDTAMPALNRAWPEAERQKVAGHILHYFKAIKSAYPSACAGAKH
jgi:hypothetical protein